MGIGPRWTVCSHGNKKVVPARNNPDPRNFTILKTKVIHGYTIAKIKYHGCTNYEGVKILVFKSNDITTEAFIDPHFCEKSHLSPIARFEPTDTGWDNAVRFVNMLIS